MTRFRRHSLDAETQLDDRAGDEDDAAVSERDVMVMRTILRCRYPLPAADVDTRIAAHEKSGQPIPAMLALEILAAQEIRDDKPHRKRMDA